MPDKRQEPQELRKIMQVLKQEIGVEITLTEAKRIYWRLNK